MFAEMLDQAQAESDMIPPMDAYDLKQVISQKRVQIQHDESLQNAHPASVRESRGSTSRR